MSLSAFLNAHRTTKNATHLSINPDGKYDITDDIEVLYDLISESKTPPHILETRKDLTCGPLLIDLDFEYPDEERFHTRQYTQDHVFKFVELIHSAVLYFFGPQEVEYVVSEKPEPTIEPGKRVKDGIHVLGKGLIMTYKDQHLLRNYALQNTSYKTPSVLIMSKTNLNLFMISPWFLRMPGTSWDAPNLDGNRTSLRSPFLKRRIPLSCQK